MRLFFFKRLENSGLRFKCVPLFDGLTYGNHHNFETHRSTRGTDFVSKALGEKRPKNIIDGVLLALKEAIKTMVEGGPTSSAVERTAALRKWMLRARELTCDKAGDFHLPLHCQEILKGKSMRLFDEMLQASDYPDRDLARQVCKGFDLLGPIPDSGVMPKKLTTAAL